MILRTFAAGFEESRILSGLGYPEKPENYMDFELLSPFVTKLSVPSESNKI